MLDNGNFINSKNAYRRYKALSILFWVQRYNIFCIYANKWLFLAIFSLEEEIARHAEGRAGEEGDELAGIAARTKPVAGSKVPEYN